MKLVPVGKLSAGQAFRYNDVEYTVFRMSEGRVIAKGAVEDGLTLTKRLGPGIKVEIED